MSEPEGLAGGAKNSWLKKLQPVWLPFFEFYPLNQGTRVSINHSDAGFAQPWVYIGEEKKN